MTVEIMKITFHQPDLYNQSFFWCQGHFTDWRLIQLLRETKRQKNKVSREIT